MTELWGSESKYNTKCLVGNWSEERLGKVGTTRILCGVVELYSRTNSS